MWVSARKHAGYIDMGNWVIVLVLTRQGTGGTVYHAHFETDTYVQL